MTVVEPKDAIARVRERGDVIKWTDSGQTFIVRRPDDAGEIVFHFIVERWHDGECYPWSQIDPLALLNVLESRDFTVVKSTEKAKIRQ